MYIIEGSNPSVRTNLPIIGGKNGRVLVHPAAPMAAPSQSAGEFWATAHVYSSDAPMRATPPNTGMDSARTASSKSSAAYRLLFLRNRVRPHISPANVISGLKSPPNANTKLISETTTEFS